MADIDMIPRSYREGLRVRRTLRAYGAALALMVLVGGGASALLRWRLALETPQLAQGRTSSVQNAALLAQVSSAQERKNALAENVETLAALRGAGEIDTLARLLNGTLNDKVWFEQLRFARTQELLQTAPSPLPQGTVQVRAAGTVQAWQLGSHVEIEGRALDNAGLTAFLAMLTADPRLDNVRFLNSGTAAPEEGAAMAFNATGSLVKRKETP